MDFQKISDAIEKAPEVVKNILFSEETGKFLNELASANSLDEDKTLRMIDEVGYVVLGLKERSDFKSSLVSIGIPKEQVLTIITEVNRRIFMEIDKVEDVKKAEIEIPKEISPISIEAKLVTPTEKPIATTPEVIHNSLPMIEKGEVVHTVPHVEEVVKVVPINKPRPEVPQPIPPIAPASPQQAPKPQIPEAPKVSHYEKGKDPYREPLV